MPSTKKPLLKKSNKGYSLVKGLTYLDSELIGKINVEERIHHRAISSRFRFYTPKELFRRLFLVSPLYKGTYGFAYAEFGRGLSIAVSIDIVELFLGPESPIHLELEISGEVKRSTESYFLLCRLFQSLPENTISTEGFSYATTKPFTLHILSGKRLQYKAKVGANFWTGYTSPIALGIADIRFKMVEISGTASYQHIKSCYIEPSPGWYDDYHSNELEEDLDKVVKIGAKIGLKEKSVEWLRNNVLKLAEHAIRDKRGRKVPKVIVRELINEIKKLPDRTIWDRIKKFKDRASDKNNPFTRPGSGEILEHLNTINSLLITNEAEFKSFFTKEAYSQIISQLEGYIESIIKAAKLNHEVLESGMLPAKIGNEAGQMLHIYEHLSILNLVVSGPKGFNLEVGFFNFDIGKAQEQADDEKLNWIDDPTKKAMETLEGNTIGKFDLYQKGKDATIGLNPKVGAKAFFTSLKGFFQTWNPTIPGKQPLVFSQYSKVSYSISQFSIGNGVVLSTDNPIYFDEDEKKEEKTERWDKVMADTFIDKELIDRFSSMVMAKAKEKFPEKTIAGIKDLLKTSYGVGFKGKYKIISTGNLADLNLGLTIYRNNIEYSSISGYWAYPKKVTDCKEVKLEEGSGLNFGISIEKNYLISLARGAMSITAKTKGQKLNKNKVYGEFFRIAAALKVRAKDLKSFLHGIYKLYNADKDRWTNDEKTPSSLLLESSFSLVNSINVPCKIKDKKIINVEDLYKVKDFQEYIKSGQAKDEKFKLETLRVRHRVSDSVSDSSSFSLGVKVGVGIRVGFENFKNAGNESVKDLLIFLPEAKEFYFEGFPRKHGKEDPNKKVPFMKYKLCNLDQTVTPTIFFPHSFPDSEE